MVSSIVSAASRYQAVTASRWPMRWQRSSAWSCMAGVHSSSRKATFEARVSVMPCAATRVAQTISCGPSGSWKARDGLVALGDLVAAQQVQRVAGSAPDRLLDLDVAGEDDERLAGGEEVVDPGQRGVELAARGQALQRAELRQALGAQRRGDARVELAQVQRLLAQPGDRRRARPAGTRARCRARPARRPGAWPGSWGRTSDFSRRTKQRRRRCQCRRSSESWPRNWREKRAPEPKSSRRPITRSWLMSSSAWLSTGVPVSARRRPSGHDRLGQAAHRLRALGLRVLAQVRLVDDERARAQARRAPRGGRRRSRS